jgi:hypothetical protein
LADSKLNILLVGGGGREHALARRIAASPLTAALYAAPGNAGIADCARCFPIAVDDIDRLVTFAPGWWTGWPSTQSRPSAPTKRRRSWKVRKPS